MGLIVYVEWILQANIKIAKSTICYFRHREKSRIRQVQYFYWVAEFLKSHSLLSLYGWCRLWKIKFLNLEKSQEIKLSLNACGFQVITGLWLRSNFLSLGIDAKAASSILSMWLSDRISSLRLFIPLKSFKSSDLIRFLCKSFLRNYWKYGLNEKKKN